MSTKKLSRPAMDMEEEEEITSGQVHGSEHSAKQRKWKEKKTTKLSKRTGIGSSGIVF